MDITLTPTRNAPSEPVTPISGNESVHRSPSERLFLRDLLGRNRLPYIDYKVEYGLRYDPKVVESKHQAPQHHSAPVLPWIEESNEEEKPPTSSTVPLLLPEGASVAENETSSITSHIGVPSVSVRPNGSVSNVMRPPTRIESAFALIEDRLQKLFHHSLEPNSTESRVLERLKSPLTLFSLFNIIKFENTPCVAKRDNLTTVYGICYHEMECNQLGGKPMDLCAAGFGVCCVFQLGCSEHTAQNISYFQSPGYPMAVQTRLACSLAVGLRWNVRQVLLEFVFFEMAPPIDGNCLDDQLIISVQNSYRKYPALCGINSGQHVYLQIDRDSSHFLYLTAVSKSEHPKAFNIRITQLATPEAPEGCLQYYGEVNGYIKSFNYDNQSVIVSNSKPSYLNNLNYAICIKRKPNFCSTKFSNVGEDGEENEFQLINLDEEGTSLVQPNSAGVEIYSCPDDFVAIGFLRLCGERLNDGSSIEDYTKNSPVTDDSAGPIIVAFRSNGESVGRGFKLKYQQKICKTRK
ncbi:uncharacterized protein LOC131428477 [Malaya genurostris]|uniref:uncharacterized protein LOC131428477 n=1 Tax=Malaya genurostris TaxID=325434 RepID=UPI0026F3E852|nr:uncharacterized protein LOC131428477 [Malaya genurostris]